MIMWVGGKKGEKKKIPIIYLSQGGWLLQCVNIREEYFVLVEDTKCVSRRYCGSLPCWSTCPSHSPSCFLRLCWRQPPSKMGEMSWSGGVLRCGADAVCPQAGMSHPSGHRGVGGEGCPPLLESQPPTSAMPGAAIICSMASLVWQAAFVPLAALLLPGGAWLLAGWCWSPSGPPATDHATHSGPALAALAPLWAHCGVLELLGELEEMLKQKRMLLWP